MLILSLSSLLALFSLFPRYTNDRAWLGKMTLIDLPTKKTSALDSSAVLKKLCNWAEEV